MIRVDRERCIGAAQCILVAPEVFGQDDAGLVVLRSTDSTVDGVQEAEELCPARAIAVSPVPGRLRRG